MNSTTRAPLLNRCEPPESFRCQIVKKINDHREKLESWLAEKEKNIIVPPHTSIDLRDSGFKACPVDSNVFPGGFNNICREDWEVCAKGFRQYFDTRVDHPIKRILIVPENHTSNKFYWENVLSLSGMLKLADYEVIVGHLNEAFGGESTVEVETASGRKLRLEKIERVGNRLQTISTALDANDLVLLNNDLSNGLPAELFELEHIVTPSPKLGWHLRKKSTHLEHYNRLAQEVAKLIEIDPFLISAEYSFVSNIDFMKNEGTDRVARETDALLKRISHAYEQHGIKEVEPFVFIKHNSGTYGRSIMKVRSGDEVLQMNRKAKNKMDISKGGVKVDDVILMEGIPTALIEDNETAEPVIYLAGSDPIGGFLRMNPNRDAHANLNSPGAHFKTLCFANMLRDPNADTVILEHFYGLLGKLSTLANGLEMQ